jgi:hypothetical protein
MDIENERLPPAINTSIDVPSPRPAYHRTLSSPSTRRRTPESTLSRIREAVDGQDDEGGVDQITADTEFQKLADHIAGR